MPRNRYETAGQYLARLGKLEGKKALVSSPWPGLAEDATVEVATSSAEKPSEKKGSLLPLQVRSRRAKQVEPRGAETHRDDVVVAGL